MSGRKFLFILKETVVLVRIYYSFKEKIRKNRKISSFIKFDADTVRQNGPFQFKTTSEKKNTRGIIQLERKQKKKRGSIHNPCAFERVHRFFIISEKNTVPPTQEQHRHRYCLRRDMPSSSCTCIDQSSYQRMLMSIQIGVKGRGGIALLESVIKN